MTHKDAIIQQIKLYSARHPKARFIGYNTVNGSRMYGTLKDIPTHRCIETPVAENLMMSMAFGMALEGYWPVVCFERHDFLLLALDSLVNHIDKLPFISGNQYKLRVVVRAIIGAKEPLNPGQQHVQDYTNALVSMLKHTHVYRPQTASQYADAWGMVGKTASGAVVIVESRDDYDKEIPHS